MIDDSITYCGLNTGCCQRQIPIDMAEHDRLIAEATIAQLGRCIDCKRNADNREDEETRCPIQERYALMNDGYCYLFEPVERPES